MNLELLQVDAFTRVPFRGNPAAVCLLAEPAPDAWMQALATEMNLSETAFVVLAGGATGALPLRWFTPTTEVRLCGHATLASAHALWETGHAADGSTIVFDTLGGRLRATRSAGTIAVALPERRSRTVPVPTPLVRALGGAATQAVRWVPDPDPDFLVELASEAEVRGLVPDLDAVRALEAGLIVTARSESPGTDVVSRYFAPSWGIDEDPVTGSAHAALVPYWVDKLGTATIRAFQASARGGWLSGRVEGGAVVLDGEAVTVFHGRVSAAAMPGA